MIDDNRHLRGLIAALFFILIAILGTLAFLTFRDLTAEPDSTWGTAEPTPTPTPTPEQTPTPAPTTVGVEIAPGIELMASRHQAWNRAAVCISGGIWDSTNDWEHRGGLGIHRQTWWNFGGMDVGRLPEQASPQEQMVIAERILWAGHQEREAQGPQAWPERCRDALPEGVG